MQQSERKKESGFTFAELAFAMLIMVAGAVVLIDHISVNYRTTATERDRVFAYSKAQAMLAEIQAFVDRGQVDAAVDLDVLDDGIVTKNTLTIQTVIPGGALVPPDHVVSGNYQRGPRWVWSRRITVQPFLGLNNRNVRYVTVRVFKRDADGTENPMADLSAVINSAGSAFPTSQVFDVYLLAVENIPGWWVFMDSIKPFVESMITDLENRNPGLSFRTHWITKASFGRNGTYRPYTNEATDSYAPISEVYHYPGRMPAGSASAYYYVPDNIQARINVDGVERNGYDSVLNPEPYALADFFNHAMRYPDEKALWDERVQLIEAREQQIIQDELNGLTPPPELTDMSKEPTYRLFVEDLATDPDKYKNALIINLHGELMPMPAMRNFSDAARDPVNHPEWRVVTHPEELRTRNDGGGAADPLRLRMYAYKSESTILPAEDHMTEPMVVEIMGVDLRDMPGNPTRLNPLVTLQNLPGGVFVPPPFAFGADYPPSWQTAKHSSDPLATGEMYYEVEYEDRSGTGETSSTLIYLYETPLGCGLDANSRGLSGNERSRLYGMDYIPSPVALGSFRDLTVVGAGPKNTARWTLSLDPAVLTSGVFVDNLGANYDPPGDVRLQVKTRIASNFASNDDWKTSGATFPTLNQPDNLSTTYAWWTDSREDVPMTERAQFLGDPRHMPYLDCCRNGNDFADSYNWYHDNLRDGIEDSATDYPCINSALLRDRWQSSMQCDVPRLFEVVRTGVVNSACVYTTLTGFSYYYLGIGNDIGYDSANGYPNSIPSNMAPYFSAGNGYLNTITGARRYACNWDGARFWVGLPWLGELYPDEHAAQWLDTAGGTPRGNLGTGFSFGDFGQVDCQTAQALSSRQAYGTVIFNNHQRTAGEGCSTFFNIGTNSSRFGHVFSGGNGNLTAIGQEIADNYNMTMPTTAPISRPFVLNQSGTGGNHWNYVPYQNNRYTASIYRTYYTHGSGTGSGIVKLVNPSNTSAAYIIVNGIDNTVASGTTFIAKFAVLSLAHSFFEAGSTTNTLRIPQLPRVEIESPTDITELNDPADVDILYGIEWTRWDGEPYAQTGTFSENESLLEYVIMYSPDNGTTWLYVQDDSPAVRGQRPTDNAYIVNDVGPGDETFTWPVPSVSFPEGSYLLRIDCYRQGAQVHYSWHQNKIFIQR